jgi:hypothetical protein
LTLIKANFDQAADFSPVKDDIYLSTIKDVSTFNSKEKGTPMIKVQFQVLDSKNGALNRMFFRNFPLAGEGTGFLRTFLKELEIPEKAFTDTSQLIGKQLKIRLKVELWEGQEQSRVVAWYNAKK